VAGLVLACGVRLRSPLQSDERDEGHGQHDKADEADAKSRGHNGVTLAFRIAWTNAQKPLGSRPVADSIMPDAAVPEVREVTLADLVRVLWGRRYVLMVTFLLVVAGGVAYTVLKTPLYSSRSTIVALEQQDIIQRWLESRQAAEWVAETLGGPLDDELFGGSQPSQERAGRVVAGLVDVVTVPPVTGRTDRTMNVDVTFHDAGLARDIANAYLGSLEVIRPTLQNVTESALFAQFYDGQNAQDARRQAHEVALEREYWIVVDPAYAATEPSSPNVQLNIALSVVLGLMLGVLAAFVWQWAANYRLASRAPAAPPPETGGGGDGTFRYRGR
jgi:capsular polysaccharide biosynthesis protein